MTVILYFEVKLNEHFRNNFFYGSVSIYSITKVEILDDISQFNQITAKIYSGNLLDSKMIAIKRELLL